MLASRVWASLIACTNLPAAHPFRRCYYSAAKLPLAGIGHKQPHYQKLFFGTSLSTNHHTTVLSVNMDVCRVSDQSRTTRTKCTIS
jgi:hypothetical protein